MKRWILLLLVFTIGCAATPAPRLYRLHIPVTAQPASSLPDGHTVVLDPVHIPRYLDRPQIVTRKGGYELFADDANRWAAPLDRHITRILGGALDRKTAKLRVITRMEAAPEKPMDRIVTEIFGFSADETATVRLAGYWQKIPRKGPAGKKQTFSIETRAENQTPTAIVAAMSAAMETLAEQMAAGLSRNLPEAQAEKPADPLYK